MCYRYTDNLKIMFAGSRGLPTSLFEIPDPEREWIYSNLCLIITSTKKMLPVIVMHGGCKNSPDLLAENIFGNNTNVEVRCYPADWNKYGKRAGFLRNAEMVSEADVLFAFWDGKSKGTKHSIDLALDKGIPVFVYILDKDKCDKRKAALDQEDREQQKMMKASFERDKLKIIGDKIWE
jgi:hypothetical protein